MSDSHMNIVSDTASGLHGTVIGQFSVSQVLEELQRIGTSVPQLINFTQTQTARIDNLGTEIRQMKEDAQALRQTLDCKEKELTSLKGECNEKTMMISSLQKELHTVKEELLKISLERDEATSTCRAKTELLDKLQAEFRDHCQLSDQHISQLSLADATKQHEINKLTAEVEALLKSQEQIKCENVEKSTAIDRYVKEIESLTTTNGTLVDQTSKIQMQLMEAQQKLQEQTDLATQLQHECSSKSTVIETQLHDLARLKDESATSRQELCQQVEGLMTRVNELTQQNLQIGPLQALTADLQTKLAALNASVCEKDTQIDLQEKRLSQITENLASKETVVSDLKTKIADLEQHTAALQLQLHEKDKSLSDMTTEIHTHQSSIADVLQQLTQKDNELKEAQQELSGKRVLEAQLNSQISELQTLCKQRDQEFELLQSNFTSLQQSKANIEENFRTCTSTLNEMKAMQSQAVNQIETLQKENQSITQENTALKIVESQAIQEKQRGTELSELLEKSRGRCAELEAHLTHSTEKTQLQETEIQALKSQLESAKATPKEITENDVPEEMLQKLRQEIETKVRAEIERAVPLPITVPSFNDDEIEITAVTSAEGEEVSRKRPRDLSSEKNDTEEREVSEQPCSSEVFSVPSPASSPPQAPQERRKSKPHKRRASRADPLPPKSPVSVTEKSDDNAECSTPPEQVESRDTTSGTPPNEVAVSSTPKRRRTLTRGLSHNILVNDGKYNLRNRLEVCNQLGCTQEESTHRVIEQPLYREPYLDPSSSTPGRYKQQLTPKKRKDGTDTVIKTENTQSASQPPATQQTTPTGTSPIRVHRPHHRSSNPRPAKTTATQPPPSTTSNT
ncbi:hypothetical protein Pelo_10549 [Pelomyxa schiedti]|nr:hypothetical protein Pelo_10549 [Pelomyxa schiedti]